MWFNASLTTRERGPWFKNTIFLFLGDHSIWIFPENGKRDLSAEEKVDAFFRTPLLIWSPGRIEPGVDDTLGSQIDLAPTVLQLLQLEATHAFQGISLLTDVAAEKRVVLMGNENAWSIRSAATRCYATGQACFARGITESGV